MQRAYSTLVVKGADDATRRFVGIASTPSVDRMGDIVEPTGGRIALPVPLLLHHDSTKPVGSVEAADVTGRGITVRCRIAQPESPGVLQDRCAEAWDSVKTGIIRGLSIGFRALGDGIEAMRDGGLRYRSWELLELSLVAIPANADATITSVKRYAGAGRARGGVQLLTAERRAATGRKGVVLITASTPSANARAQEFLREMDQRLGRPFKPSGRQAVQAGLAGTIMLRDELEGLAERVEALERQK